MDKTSKIALALVAVAIIVVVGFSINKKETPTLSPVTSVVEKDEYRELYMSGCSEDGTHFAFCNCSYDYLLNNYGKEGISELGIDYSNTGVFSEPMKKAVSSCISLY